MYIVFADLQRIRVPRTLRKIVHKLYKINDLKPCIMII
jgi:hypothetical protein